MTRIYHITESIPEGNIHGWHDAAFQSKNYDTETYKKVQNNSYKIARRSIILLQVGVGFLIPFALTIVMDLYIQ
jgi:hypothetical protein